MKVTAFLLAICVILFTLLLSRCSLPEDIEPVRWNMHLEVPIIDEHLTIDDVVPGGSLAGLTVDFGDTAVSRDTVSITRSDSLQYTIEKQLGSTDTSEILKTFGPLSLKNTPPVDVVLGLGTDLPLDAPLEVALPAAVTLSKSQEKILDGIQQIRVDESSPMLSVVVTNLSEGAALKDVYIFLSSGADTVGIVYVPLLHALASGIVPISIAGRYIYSQMTIAATVTVTAGSVVRSVDGLRVAFSLDNQAIAEAVISDSCIDYSDMLEGTLTIADSLRIDAIDIDSALLYCEMYNPACLKLEVVGTLHNAWALDYSESLDLQQAEQLTGDLDSSAFAGEIFRDTLFRSGDPVSGLTVPIRSMRVFPLWKPDSLKSFVSYCFKVTALPDGRTISFNKDYQFLVRLIRDQFPFIRIGGEFVKGTERSFSINRRVGFEWKPSITDSLKKSLRFESGYIHLDFVPGLPPGSYIDSLLVRTTISHEDTLYEPVVFEENLTAIEPGSHYTATLDLTDLLNAWPDSIRFDTRLIIPPCSKVTLYNSKDEFGGLASALSIDLTLHWSVDMPFSWEIADTVRTELEPTTFSFQAAELDWVKDLRNPRVKVVINADNRTNLHFILFGIGASVMYRDKLDDLPEKMVGTDKLEEYIGDHLFSLFDNDGLCLKPRGETTDEILMIDRRGIDAMLSEEKCCIRWFLIIPAGETDALMATDYLDLRATGIIDGTGNSDSLLYTE
jgi:hypothetical protein